MSPPRKPRFARFSPQGARKLGAALRLLKSSAPRRPAASLALLLALATWGATAPAAQAAEGEPLGRLFLTPEQRAALSRGRTLGLPQGPTTREHAYTLNGVVRRSGGRSTAWINGVPLHDRETAGAVRVLPRQGESGRAVVAVGEDKPVSLKVGESIDPASGSRDDPLEGGSVRVHRAVSSPTGR
ncbi:MAG: hypothetical protein HY778_14065 [Betaproteobacteria bacterium]|nr:hypothetical protein [Betaproteobacteria bacterium]